MPKGTLYPDPHRGEASTGDGLTEDDSRILRIVHRISSGAASICHAHGVASQERAGSPIAGGIGVLEISGVHPVQRWLRFSITYLSGTCGAAAQVSWTDVERVVAAMRGGDRRACSDGEVALIARPPSAPGGRVALQDFDVGPGKVELDLVEVMSRDVVRLRILIDDSVVAIDVGLEDVHPAVADLLGAVDEVSS